MQENIVESYLNRPDILEIYQQYGSQALEDELPEEELLSPIDSKWDYSTIMRPTFDFTYQMPTDKEITQISHKFIVEAEKSFLDEYLSLSLKPRKPKVCRNCQYEMDQLSSYFVEEIQRFPFQKYWEQNVLYKRSIFSSKQPLLQYSKTLENLTLQSEAHKEIIKQILYDILCFGREIETKQPKSYHAKRILQLSMREHQFIKDEIYLQIIRQISKNYRTQLFYHQLICLYCTYVHPSKEMVYPMINFFYNLSHDQPNALYQTYCKYFIKRILITTNSPKELKVPSENEIISVLMLKPLVYQIDIYRQNAVHLEIDPTITAVKVLELVKLKLKLTNPQYLILCLQINYKEKITYHLFNDDEQIFNTIKKFTTTYNLLGGEYQLRLILKTLYLNVYDSLEYFNLAYIISCQEYLNNEYQLEDSEVVSLGALKLVADFGSQDQMIGNKLQITDLHHYVPLQRYNKLTEDSWMSQILKAYFELSISHRRLARCKLLDAFRTQLRFLSYCIQCKNNLNKNISIVFAQTGINIIEQGVVYLQFSFEDVEVTIVNSKQMLLNHFDENVALYFYEESDLRCSQLLINKYKQLQL